MELTASLKQDGLLCPLFVVKTGEFIDQCEIFEILDGQRRFAASETLPELQRLACFIFESGISTEELIAFQIVVNANRANLSAADQARAIFQLFELSKAKTINEFVNGEHGLAFGEVWLRNLIVVGAAEKSASGDKRKIFERVQSGQLGVAKASKLLAQSERAASSTKRRKGRPERSRSPEAFVVAEQYRIPLGGLGEWSLAVIAPKRADQACAPHPIRPAALKAAANELLLRASKDDN